MDQEDALLDSVRRNDPCNHPGRGRYHYWFPRPIVKAYQCWQVLTILNDQVMRR
jgi:hypothetical protein